MPHRRQRPRIDLPHDPVGWPPPETISAADMDDAVLAAEAAAFSQVITFIRRYQEIWWLSTPAGWLQIRPPVATVLDEHAERMRQPAHKRVANAASIRAVIELAREATKATISRQ
jgi:hypothetical protein